MATLSTAELAQYRDQGYVVPEYRLGKHRLQALRNALERVIGANPDTRPEQLVSIHITGRNAEGVTGDAAFLELARDPEILERVADVIGPDVVLWGCQAFCKPAGDGMEVPWHQDGHYWPIEPLATCTVWIALDHSTVENGCMRFIPGSHRNKTLLGHELDPREGLTLNRKVVGGAIDLSSAVDIELEPGQMSLHDVHMVHGSAPNTSGERRAGIAIRYMPATSHFDRDRIATSSSSGYKVDFATRPLWLLRGMDSSGKNDFAIGHASAQAATA